MVAAVSLGAAIPISGFAPVNNLTDVVPVTKLAWLALVTPPFLIVYFAAVLAAVLPAATARAPRTLTLGTLLLLAGALLSLTATDTLNDTWAMVLLGLVAPGCLFMLLRRSDLPQAPMLWAFLIVSSLFLLRADIVFFGDYGFGPPSGVDLFAAKFSNAPYDFHYYALGNPDQSSTYTMLPFAIGCYIASDRRTRPATRALAIGVAVICALTLVLLYVRVPLALAALIATAALVRSPLRLAVKIAALAVVTVLVVRFATDATTSEYLGKVFDTGNDSSGGVRIGSIGDGFEALGNHPFAGMGFGRFGYRDGRPPAHSAVAQIAADTGVLGLVGSVLAFGTVLALTVRAWRRRASLSVATGAVATGLGVYALLSILVGGATAGVAVGFVSVWGLSVGMLLATLTSPVRAEALLPERRIWAFDRSLFDHPRTASAIAGFAVLLGGLAVLLATVRDRGDTLVISLPGGRAVATRPIVGKPVARWSFRRGLPKGWAGYGIDPTSAGGYLRVRTTAVRNAYQLGSPNVLLSSGSYIVRLNARIDRGGMQIAVIDTRTGDFRATGEYPVSRRRSETPEYAMRFRVPRTGYSQVVLANSGGGSSRWRLRDLALRPVH